MAKRRHRKQYRGPDLTARLDLTIGDTLELVARSFDRLGNATADIDGAPVTIAGAIPGEVVTCEVVGIYPERVATRTIAVSERSDQRITPQCGYFGECSGCQWQHVDYEYQLLLKREIVESALAGYERLAGVPIDETMPSPLQFGYRNHARFTVGRGTDAGYAGFKNADSRRFVRIDECKIMDGSINEVLVRLQGRLERMTQLSVRTGAKTGDVIVQPLLPAEIQDVESGRQLYVEEVRGAEFQVAASSFFQVNTLQLEQLVDAIVSLLDFDGDETIIDLYCGVGTFARLLAPYVREVIGVEESASAIENAKANTTGIENVTFIAAKAEDAAAEMSANASSIDTVVIDPPRSGCAPDVLSAILTVSPRRVMMVSCNPVTLARDLDLLCEGGYRLATVKPVDMFPQTRHVETLALLER